MSSPLPSICFLSPCDHICFCFKAETIEIYGVETLERSAALLLFFSLRSV